MSSTIEQRQPEVLVLIPSVTATHVLGESSATLGQGDLTLVLTNPSQQSADKQIPVLALTVGEAAFPLFPDTAFGTLAGDKRSYVFTPELGGEKRGYVKISLPEGISEESSQLGVQQEHFERVLIDHGLLKPEGAH